MFFVFHVSTLARLASPPVLGVVAGRSFRALCIVIDVAPSPARGLVELVRKVQMLHLFYFVDIVTLSPTVGVQLPVTFTTLWVACRMCI